jgi:hypothetical protein
VTVVETKTQERKREEKRERAEGREATQDLEMRAVHALVSHSFLFLTMVAVESTVAFLATHGVHQPKVGIRRT